MHSAGPALRASNLVALTMMFGLGFAFGRATQRNPWLMAIAMVLVGVLLVGMTIALGG
jgi:VIT1/CCC1 family predicted Fe2+/Mn2+ transporter